MISHWNALLWEMVNAPKLDVIRSRLDIFQKGCVSDKRSYWAQLVIICTSELGMADKEPENVMKICESRLVGFLISSLSIIERFWAQKLIECFVTSGRASTAINSLSRCCIDSIVLTAVEYLFIDCQWSMTWKCSLQTVRGGKRWFYIIVGLAITMCSCAELIQLSLLLLLLKVWGFFKENNSHLRRIKYHPENKTLTQIRKTTAGNITENKSAFYLTLSSTFPWGNERKMRSKNAENTETEKRWKEKTEVMCVIGKCLEMLEETNILLHIFYLQALLCKNNTKPFQPVLVITL